MPSTALTNVSTSSSNVVWPRPSSSITRIFAPSKLARKSRVRSGRITLSLDPIITETVVFGKFNTSRSKLMSSFRRCALANCSNPLSQPRPIDGHWYRRTSLAFSLSGLPQAAFSSPRLQKFFEPTARRKMYPPVGNITKLRKKDVIRFLTLRKKRGAWFSLDSSEKLPLKPNAGEHKITCFEISLGSPRAIFNTPMAPRE
mmetsp:Transcript_11594/g.33428  ORF Transcript_11594/g.33428 Transcript_11594/m.33428 type:complete len:201 (-) Transcript_11594:1082-1684(-)